MGINIDFSKISDELASVPYKWAEWSPDELLKTLKEAKKSLLKDGQDDAAKDIWCYETITNIYGAFIRAFKEMKKKAFYEAWCILEKIEIELRFLSRHFDIYNTEYYLEFILNHKTRFQGLFPYAIFFSPEILKHEIKCGICGEVVTPRNKCSHRVGEIYKGEMCYREVTKAEFLSISAVTNPVQKYSVAFLSDEDSGKTIDQYDYSVVRFVIDRLSSPFHEWSYKWVKKRHPHERFSNYSPEDSCPCESGNKYKECCLPTNGVLRPHCDINFSVLPQAGLSMFEYTER